jgi:hypothetical protein
MVRANIKRARAAHRHKLRVKAYTDMYDDFRKRRAVRTKQAAARRAAKRELRW